MLDLAIVGAGMRVLDVATGRGDPAISAAKRVSPNGTVVGIDADPSMLKLAREQAEREGVTNIELAVSSAEALRGIPADSFDVVLARWGLMYFQDPLQALHSARRVLKPGGLLVAAVWAAPDSASFVELPRAVLSRLTSIPPLDLDSRGTFYYANEDRLSQHLKLAGFKIQQMEDMFVDVMEATSADELIAWARVFGMSQLLQDTPVDIQRNWEKDLAAGAEPYRGIDGLIRLGGISRVVTAS